MRWVGHVAYMGERTSAYRVLVGRPNRGRALGRPRHRWGRGVIINEFSRRGMDGKGWIHLAQDWDRWQALVNAVMNLQVP
jgi:hypothetical protein